MLKKVAATMTLLFGTLAVLPSVSYADSWLPPTQKTYTSPDGNTRVIVTPRGIAGAVEYFQDKAAEKDHAGQAHGAPATASAEVQRRDGTEWRPVRTFALVNDVAPASALVANDGHLVTFDNWHSAGFGPDVVVIYDAKGKRIRSLALEDFLPKDWIRHLPRTVSSLWWGGDHAVAVDGRTVALHIAPPGTTLSEAKPVPVLVRIQLIDGSVVPPSGARWDAAIQRSRELEAKRQADWNVVRTARAQPLLAPKTRDHHAWRAYAVELRARLSHDGTRWCGDVFDAPERDEEHPSFKLLLMDFADPAYSEWSQQCVLVSPDTSAMVADLAKALRELPANALKGDSLAITGKPGDEVPLEPEVVRTGLTLRVIDVREPFPGKVVPEAVPDWFEGPER